MSEFRIVSNPERSTPLARKLLRELDLADPQTFRRLTDHLDSAASEGFCPICMEPLKINTNGSWCPGCAMCWDERRADIAIKDEFFREFWMLGWQHAFLPEDDELWKERQA